MHIGKNNAINYQCGHNYHKTCVRRLDPTTRFADDEKCTYCMPPESFEQQKQQSRYVLVRQVN
jgi:hypothetical protein